MDATLPLEDAPSADEMYPFYCRYANDRAVMHGVQPRVLTPDEFASRYRYYDETPGCVKPLISAWRDGYCAVLATDDRDFEKAASIEGVGDVRTCYSQYLSYMAEMEAAGPDLDISLPPMTAQEFVRWLLGLDVKLRSRLIENYRRGYEATLTHHVEELEMALGEGANAL